MNTKLLIASVVLLAYSVSTAYGRDLLVEVIGGKVKRMDTLTTDPYISVTVCKEKKQTQTLKRTLNPVWNWRHQFKNVRDDCRLKFHLYDEEIAERDDTIGEFETTVGNFLKERNEASTLSFGKRSESAIQIRVKYV